MNRPSGIDILTEIIENMDFGVEIISATFESEITINGKSYFNIFILNCCDIIHAQPTFQLTINDKIFKIVEINGAENIIYLHAIDTVANDFFDSINSFQLYRPYLFHGTPIATDDELKDIPVASDCTPMIWVMDSPEQSRSDFYYSSIDPLFMRINKYIFFLTQYNDQPKGVTQTANNFHTSVNPMRRLANRFYNNLLKRVDLFEAYKLTHWLPEYSIFGVYITGKGMPKQMFSQNLSGCQMIHSGIDVTRAACGLCVSGCE